MADDMDNWADGLLAALKAEQNKLKDYKGERDRFAFYLLNTNG